MEAAREEPAASATLNGAGVSGDKSTVLETSECAVQSISQRKRRFCPHCREEVAIKTFKFHKRLHYDKVSGVPFCVLLMKKLIFSGAW